MAKKFGRNQKRKLKEQQVEQQREDRAAFYESLNEMAAKHDEEVNRLRGQVRDLDTRRNHQVVINLAIDRNIITDERSLRATMHSTDHRHKSIATSVGYDARSVKYSIGYREEQEAVAYLTEIAAKMISEDLFGHMRNQWGVGYGRDPKPLSRREQYDLYRSGQGPSPY